MEKGWFTIRGLQDGDRTLAQQMMGMGDALAFAKGKTVFDLGCAEGMISFEFEKAGARRVDAVDYKAHFIGTAMRMAAMKQSRVNFRCADISTTVPGYLLPQYDIVLALAVLHKMHDPEIVTRRVAGLVRHMLVVRLPHGSDGRFKSKYRDAFCDLADVLPAEGLMLVNTAQGPNEELVQYWQRGA